ncbi:MAG: MarR family transcriptional regulator [Firmicutes bacterium]|nr:MarR family transcriptional regulator [Bacillota bacterium]
MDHKSIGKYISIIYRQQQIIINRKLKKYNLGSGQYMFLIVINKHEGLSQKDLSKMLDIDKATTARAIKKLIDLNFIKRKKDKDDKRIFRLFIDEKGRKLMPEIEKTLKEITEISKKGLKTKEVGELFRLLDIVMNNNKSYIDK